MCASRTEKEIPDDVLRIIFSCLRPGYVVVRLPAVSTQWRRECVHVCKNILKSVRPVPAKNVRLRELQRGVERLFLRCTSLRSIDFTRLPAKLSIQIVLHTNLRELKLAKVDTHNFPLMLQNVKHLESFCCIDCTSLSIRPKDWPKSGQRQLALQTLELHHAKDVTRSLSRVLGWCEQLQKLVVSNAPFLDGSAVFRALGNRMREISLCGIGYVHYAEIERMASKGTITTMNFRGTRK